jgi:eukaryotic-like serine/threonine-protein kinase
VETGRIIDGRYEVERTLASGGMATVHVVRHLSLDSKHALKILHIPSPDIRERLLLEGRLQARLRHPNIVAVTDTLTIDGAPGLILELVEGPALDEWLASQRPSLDEAEAIFLGILAAVDHAHRHGVVHRDLKPANVLLAPLAGGFLPKVADFGIAKVVEDILGEKGGRQKTRTGVAMGTPAYMSPEQIEGARDLGPAADVFALGCILYELVVGKPAFDGPTLLSVLTASREGFYDDPADVTPELPERFVAAIRGALAPELDERIPDCATLARVLTAGRVGSLSGAGPVVDARAPFEPRAYPRGLGSNPRRSQETFGADDLGLPRRPDAEPKAPSRDGPSTAALRWGPLEVDAAAEAQERRR